jgi:transglutaminase-like putative cysteine protease
MSTALSRPFHGHWLLASAVGLAVAFSSLSLNGVFEGWDWLADVVLTIAAALAATSAARSLRAPDWLVPVAGLLALTGFLTFRFFPGANLLGFIPTGATLDLLPLHLATARDTVVSQVAPVLPNAGIVLVMCAGIGLITVLMETMVATLQMPASAGLGLIAVLVTPAIIKPRSIGIGGFLAAAVGYLLILGVAQWLQSRGPAGGPADGPAGRSAAALAETSAARSRASAIQLARGLAVGAAGMAVALLVPLAVPGFSSGLFPQGARLNVWGPASGLNPVITLGNDLRSPGTFGRMTYATDAERPIYLRSTTLEDFSGRRWEPDQRLDSRILGLGQLGGDALRDLEQDGATALTRISTGTFTSPWLPAPYAPTVVFGIDGAWSWDPLTLSMLSADGGTTAEQTYFVRSVKPDLTREELSQVGPVRGGSVDDRFLLLPDEVPSLIEDTAESLVSGIDSPYDQAMAIQNYLRGVDFSYSEEAPVDGGYDGSGIEVVGRFLEEKSGYCIHYASAMAVMARMANIPSRMAIGYAQGRSTGGVVIGPGGEELHEFEVDSRDAHAWPELYFQGIGWVPFEPTPSRGVVPEYALNNLSGGPDPNADDGPLNPSEATAAPAPGSAPGAQDSGADGTAERSAGQYALLTAGALVLLLAVVLSPWLLRSARARRRREALLNAEPAAAQGLARTAWDEATDLAADFGYPADPAETPRTFARRLRVEAPLDGPGGEALERLRAAFERAEYAAPVTVGAPGPAAVGAADGPNPTGRSLAADLEALRRSLSSASARGRRLRAVFLPASLWAGRTGGLD